MWPIEMKWAFFQFSMLVTIEEIYLQQKVDLQMSFSLNKVSYFPIIIPQSSQRGKSIHLPPYGLG